MKHAVINIFLFCLGVFVVTPLLGQNAVHYYFRTLDIRNGLSQNTVNAILQDKQGFMWFGTKDGLNRFDGLNFRIFKKENSNLAAYPRILKSDFYFEFMRCLFSLWFSHCYSLGSVAWIAFFFLWIAIIIPFDLFSSFLHQANL